MDNRSRRPVDSHTWLAPAKRPLIDIAMSVIAAPTMSCMFSNAAKGIAEVRKDGKLNLPLEMVLSRRRLQLRATRTLADSSNDGAQVLGDGPSLDSSYYDFVRD